MEETKESQSSQNIQYMADEQKSADTMNVLNTLKNYVTLKDEHGMLYKVVPTNDMTNVELFYLIEGLLMASFGGGDRFMEWIKFHNLQKFLIPISEKTL